MLTGIVLVLVLVAAVAIAVWWFFDFDLPEVMIPVAAPGIGAGLIYWYGGPLAWTTVTVLAAIAGYCIYRLVVNASAREHHLEMKRAERRRPARRNSPCPVLISGCRQRRPGSTRRTP